MVRSPKLTALIRVLLLTFRMVNLRPINRTSETETPDLRGMIASEVGETL